MAARMFRIGSQWLNLAFVAGYDVLPPYPWAEPGEDEAKPRIIVRMLGSNYPEVTEAEAIKAGFADIADVVDKLTAAMDAFNG